jgi:hypothetical protein
MSALVLAVVLAVVPSGLDLPPEGIYGPATVVEQPSAVEQLPTATRGTAVQVEPTLPAPVEVVEFSSASSNGRCVGAEGLLARYSPGWDVARMSRIMYRESRCRPGADNPRSTATGLLQILASHCRWLASTMGEPCSARRLTEPEYNVRAGAALWAEQGYGAWAL